MPSYPRIVLIVFAVLAVGLAWYSAARPLPAPTRPGGVKYDPIEDNERVKPIIAAVDQEVMQLSAADPPELRAQLGYGPSLWQLKKKLLQEKHGIVWRTPAEMNPGIAFD